jgi:hypothetical protein
MVLVYWVGAAVGTEEVRPWAPAAREAVREEVAAPVAVESIITEEEDIVATEP